MLNHDRTNRQRRADREVRQGADVRKMSHANVFTPAFVLKYPNMVNSHGFKS